MQFPLTYGIPHGIQRNLKHFLFFCIRNPTRLKQTLARFANELTNACQTHKCKYGIKRSNLAESEASQWSTYAHSKVNLSPIWLYPSELKSHSFKQSITHLLLSPTIQRHILLDMCSSSALYPMRWKINRSLCLIFTRIHSNYWFAPFTTSSIRSFSRS